jgi:hypothetical protein
MKIAGLQLKRTKFPGRAGELQDRHDATGFAAELGDNFDRYHRHLLAEWARTGGRPDPADFPDVPSYMDALATAEDLAKAELVLRRCAAFRRTGERSELTSAFGGPLLDADDRLVGPIGSNS